jgi:hypothetical protein
MTTLLASRKRFPLDPKQLTQEFFRVETHDDGTSKTQPSPYDVPEEIVGEYDPATRMLSLELRYIGDETKISFERLDSGVVFRSGKNSGRIYQIQVDGADASDWDAVRKRIVEGIDFVADSNKSSTSPRFGIAKKAIQMIDLRTLAPELI